MTPQPGASVQLEDLGRRACVVMAGDGALKHLFPYPDTHGIGRTAIHESAHVVVALAVGLRFRQVETYRVPVEVAPGIYEHGSTLIAFPSIAVDGAKQPSIASTTPTNSDFRTILRYARLLTQLKGRALSRQWLRAVRDETNELIGRHLEAIRLLACELETRHKLTFEEVIELGRNHWAFASVREASPHHWSAPA